MPGNRTEKSVDADGAGAGSATVTRFAYDAWNPAKTGSVGTENSDVWADFDGSSLTTRYFRGDAIDQLIARIDGTTPRWYLADEQGSINQVIDSTGVVKDALTYDAWGNILSETNAAERGRYAWTGREVDTEIALQFNRARYYDATTGRWITQDPLGFDAGDSNLYRYVNNRPVQNSDASGLQPPGDNQIAIDALRARNLQVELKIANLKNGIQNAYTLSDNDFAKVDIAIRKWEKIPERGNLANVYGAMGNIGLANGNTHIIFVNSSDLFQLREEMIEKMTILPEMEQGQLLNEYYNDTQVIAKVYDGLVKRIDKILAPAVSRFVNKYYPDVEIGIVTTVTLPVTRGTPADNIGVLGTLVIRRSDFSANRDAFTNLGTLLAVKLEAR